MWKLNNTPLNNQHIMEEIKKENKICLETNENENKTTHNLWDSINQSKKGGSQQYERTSRKNRNIK